MAMKPAAPKVHRSMQGKEIDIDMLRVRNETTLAVGNARMNARGDELGANGQIVRKREEASTEYHTDSSELRK